MKRSRRSRRVNIAISTAFDTFYRDINRYQDKTSNIDFYVERVEQAEDRLRNILFGMHLVDAMSYREYLTLKDRVHRATRQTVKKMRNW